MVTAIFPAAGQGKRMHAGMNKVFMGLCGMPILVRTLLKFSRCSEIDKLIIAIGKDELGFVEDILKKIPGLKPWRLVEGGSERQYSIYNALKTVDDDTDIVLVHDASRPLVTNQTIMDTVEGARMFGAVVAAVPAKNTIKICNENCVVQSTPDRSTLWEVQTPQGFQLDILKKANEQAIADGYLGTDDSCLVERIGVNVRVVKGDYRNIKITTPEDMVIAEAFIREAGMDKLKMGARVVYESIVGELKANFLKHN